MSRKYNTITNTLNLGEVRENTTYDLTFTLPENHKKIIQVIPSCGCTNASYIEGRIKATYATGNIPHHLKRLGKQPIKKKIKLVYSDKTEDWLYITGTKKII